MIKQCQFKGIDDRGNINVIPLFVGAGLEKTAAASEMRSKLHPKIQDFVKFVRPTPGGIYVLVNAMGAGEYWGSNVNGDLFPEKALIHSPPDWNKLSVSDMQRKGKSWDYGYPTFMGAHPYKHHVNKDPSRAFGSVELAVWNPQMHRVELVVYLDRNLCKKFDAYDIIERIENGEFPDVSMGCKVPYDVCTICEQRSKTRFDYCEHATTMMNKILPDGRKVAVRNDFPKFFDISFVFIGADKTAKVMAKLAQKNGQICMGDYCTMPRPSAELGELFSKEAGTLYHGSPTGGLETLEPRRDPRTGMKGLFLSPSREHALVHAFLPDRANSNITFSTKDNKFTHGAVVSKDAPHQEGYLYEVDDVKGKKVRKYEGELSDTVVSKRAVSPRAVHRVTLDEAKKLGWSFTQGTNVQREEGPDGKTYIIYDPVPKTASVFQSLKETLMEDPKVKAKERKAYLDHERKTDMRETIPERSYESAVDFSKAGSSLRSRALSSGIGAITGAGSSLAGSKSIKADKDSSTKDAVKDGIAGALLGVMFPFSKKAASTAIVPHRDGTFRIFHEGQEYAISRETVLRHFPELVDAHDKEFGKRKEKKANDPIKAKYEVQGVPIWVEWKNGETRLYKDKKTGKVKYERLMKADYGYIPNTKDADGEEIDVYLGPNRSAPNAYVIKQLKKSDGSFDENKVMVGYATQRAAKDAYDYHMGGTKEFFGGISAVKVTALQALFGENGDGKEKEKKAHSCECAGACDPCGGSTEKAASAIFGLSPEKYASHRKLSEILKDIPAGPFTKETLPKLEKTERDIPEDVLNLMGGLPLSSSMSTPGMLGMVLKPREFQRVLLVRMGERELADELDDKNMTFEHSREVDDSIPVGTKHVDPRLKELLIVMGFTRSRSAAAPALRSRAAASASKGSAVSAAPKTSDEPVMKKIAAAYNGYRRSLLKKAASISQYMTTDSQLRADLFGSSMAEAFAGGVDKVATAGVLSPDSLAYLVGAYTERDFHVSSKEVLASLALTGAVHEVA